MKIKDKIDKNAIVKGQTILQSINNSISQSQHSIKKGLLKQAIFFWSYVRDKNLNNRSCSFQDIALENYLHNLMCVSELEEDAYLLMKEIKKMDDN